MRCSAPCFLCRSARPPSPGGAARRCETLEHVRMGPAAGTAHNPYNLAHTCGGSSSGSAAVLAAGIAPITIGGWAGMRHAMLVASADCGPPLAPLLLRRNSSGPGFSSFWSAFPCCRHGRWRLHPRPSALLRCVAAAQGWHAEVTAGSSQGAEDVRCRLSGCAGVTGLKPTTGRVSIKGCVKVDCTVATLGPMGATVQVRASSAAPDPQGEGAAPARARQRSLFAVKARHLLPRGG